MSTQMKVAEHPEGWAVFNGESPVKIGGVVGRSDRAELVAEIESRGVFVWSDGSIQKEAEAVEQVFAQDIPDGAFVPTAQDDSGNEPQYTPPTPGPTEDPPVDPGADPEDPDPNPTVPAKPKRQRVKITADEKKLAAGSKETKAARAEYAKKYRAQMTDEQKAARAEYAKKYRAQMTDEQKAQARERAKERQKRWREAHPDKAAEFAKRSSERRKERYNEDPNFRTEYRAKQKAYAKAGKSE